jgi:pyruvate ferredoxin oxidoreductase gamma subunit
MICHPHVITKGKCYTMPFYDGLQDNGILLVNSDGPLDLSDEDSGRLAAKKANIFHVPATRIALELSGTELSTNIAMLGGLYGIRELTSQKALEESMLERFGGGKFVASGTTAVLDDAVKAKFAKVSQLIEKNMEIIRSASQALCTHAVS